MQTVILTGANRGLGLAIAHALDDDPGSSLVLAVRDLAAGHAVAARLRRPARVVGLDVGRLDEVAAFAGSWDEPVAALIHNAGLQQTDGLTFTPDGVETTLAVNHLGPLALTLGLLPRLTGGVVLGIGSGTHNPENRTATMFGFRGARFSSVAALARGEIEAPGPRQAGMDRYATSKLLSMVTAMALARRVDGVRFLTLDPGMLPGTSLVRTAPWWVRWSWSTVLRALVPVLGDASTPERAAAVVRRLLTDRNPHRSDVYDRTGAPSTRVWSTARDPALADRALDESLALLAGRAPIDRIPGPR
jgi:NAD(P)-dependent dehydrogenase (short-subunit alcohol dehydrogenase family)